MTPDTDGAYDALIQFLYQAPIGLLQTTLDGEITMINPTSAQLLMPLVPDGNLLNLFDALEPAAASSGCSRRMRVSKAVSFVKAFALNTGSPAAMAKSCFRFFPSGC